MTPDDVLKTLDSTMAMKTGTWLEECIRLEKDLVILDLRGEDAWVSGHIAGSVPIRINDLPEKATRLIPGKDTLVVSVCNGSVQSAMATMYLRTLDYKNSFNLSGGFSAWVRDGRPVTMV